MRDRDYTTLSGGEQQRVQIARVLLQLGYGSGQRYALFDEPVSSLDVAQQLRCLKVAQMLAREGVAVLVSLHDLNLAARFADRIILLRSGRVIASDVPDHALTARTLRDAFDVSARPLPLEGERRQFLIESIPSKGESRAQH